MRPPRSIGLELDPKAAYNSPKKEIERNELKRRETMR
jgi:hypothetical protein